MATGVEKVSFVPMLKGNTKECSNYHIIALISHVSQVMLKILQARLQQYVNQELPDVQAGLEKADEPEIKLPTSAGSSKKQENSRKTSTFSSLITPKTFCDYNKLWEILKEMGISHHLTCLYARSCLSDYRHVALPVAGLSAGRPDARLRARQVLYQVSLAQVVP